ncbi:uncharacterized protein LOC142329169 isoform X13 [Lycorma delicatula]|uniref:uncharacterized protein LOC142329169 isoform X13 n=1 Tax=Lycorma delicatula TaxID=130591 RepID=UPI003F51A55B
MNSVKRLRSYTVGEKLKIIRSAEEIGNRAAGRQYDISESCVRDWRKKREKLMHSSKSRRAFRGGIPKFPVVEEQLFSYLENVREQGLSVSTEMAQLKAAEIAKELQISNFKASRGWLNRFTNRKKAAAVKQEQSGEGESKQNHPSCSSSAPSFQDVGLSSTTENTEGNITGDLNKNEGDDENSILPMEVNLDDETEEPRDAQFNDTELDAEDPLNIDNTPTSTTVIETVPTPKIISTATVVNDDKPNEQKATGQNIHVRQNLTENPAPLPVVPVNPVRKRMQLKRPLPVSDILDGYNAKVSIEDEYKNYIDEDKAFLMSLLPAMKELTGPQKMEFKMTVLNELKRIRYPSSTPTPQTVGNLTVLPYAFQPIPNLANISHVIPIQQRTINPTTLQQVINKNSSTTQQTCKILSSQPPPLAAIIPQTVSATSAETAKQKQSPTVSSTATTAATVTAKPTPVEPPAKRASVSKDNNARSQPSATETKKTTSRRTPARRKPKKQAATNETQNNTEETQIITSDLTTPQDEEETRNDGELRTEIDLDEIKIEHIKVEPYDDEDTEDAMENC